jgi:hypothetical protein
LPDSEEDVRINVSPQVRLAYLPQADIISGRGVGADAVGKREVGSQSLENSDGFAGSAVDLLWSQWVLSQWNAQSLPKLVDRQRRVLPVHSPHVVIAQGHAGKIADGGTEAVWDCAHGE